MGLFEVGDYIYGKPNGMYCVTNEKMLLAKVIRARESSTTIDIKILLHTWKEEDEREYEVINSDLYFEKIEWR